MVEIKNAVVIKRINFMVEQMKNYGRGHSLEVLDLGCGIGVNTAQFGSQGYNVTAVDIDSVSIDYCKEHNTLPNVKYQVGDAKEIDLGRKYDVVVLSEVVEHVTYPELLIRNMGKHLTQDGIGIISIPNGYCLWEIVVSRFIHRSKLITWLYKSPRFYKFLTGTETPFMSKNVFCFHENYFNYGRLEKLIENNGFKITLVKHASLGILPEWNGLMLLKKIECKIADYAPHNLAGGWFLVVRRSND